jgi:hypothetical protein
MFLSELIQRRQTYNRVAFTTPIPSTPGLAVRRWPKKRVRTSPGPLSRPTRPSFFKTTAFWPFPRARMARPSTLVLSTVACSHSCWQTRLGKAAVGNPSRSHTRRPSTLGGYTGTNWNTSPSSQRKLLFPLLVCRVIPQVPRQPLTSV